MLRPNEGHRDREQKCRRASGLEFRQIESQFAGHGHRDIIADKARRAFRQPE